MPITTPVTVTTRVGKGARLSREELDANFTNLKAAADAVGNRIVTTWAALMSMSTVGVTAYVDRFFVTDVGVGGSEWYWDSVNSRYRAVGGQVVLLDLNSQPSISNTTSETAFAEASVEIPAGLLTTNSKICFCYTFNKPTVTASANVLVRLGTTGTTSDAAILNGSGVVATANKSMAGYQEFNVDSNTSIRKLGYGSAITGYVGGSSQPTYASVSVPDLSSLVTNIKLSVVMSDAITTMTLTQLTITIKTCG